ncbi:hypothetical protein [Lacibacter sediminis]|uniref:Uncharacterized protein n=1 Tax=Lacibacter sediminis TaxID=2760713 RepID=A0A7G5XMD5_9BACT|nr:hypothetical protein [Lacibacter sediminis]QNA46638.1 hypothetical protein H4075_10845 [Lacibacter sediminis]
MNYFLTELKRRNQTLYFFSLICLVGAVVCIAMIIFSDTVVLGINAWYKPMKFFLSTVIFSCTMGWFMHYLNRPLHTKFYSRTLIITLAFELVYITLRASQGQLSHFNISSAFNGLMFSLMGIAISIITLWTAYVAFLFWKESFPQLPPAYLWGIRFGLVLFVVFAFSGGMMAARLSHTVGSAMETTQGLPVLNWSRESGDLRIAHFFGMHALQLLPLLGFFVTRTKQQIIILSLIYAAAVSALLLQALNALPLVPLQ